MEFNRAFFIYIDDVALSRTRSEVLRECAYLVSKVMEDKGKALTLLDVHTVFNDAANRLEGDVNNQFHKFKL